ncbi:MAG TPA: hypothetical protein PLJ35_05260 [Anaerolineae bacterium]|nr:hypothetical protein [Anaerolineae bacterium]
MLTGKNDAITTLAAELAAGAGSCTVTDASKLPATFPYRLRIWDWATYRQPADDAGEIVEVTNAVGNVLTITRAQEGTADVLHAAGETCANTITWAYVDEMQSAIAARALAGAVTASGLTMATGKILGRATASTGAIEELELDTDGTLAANSDSNVPSQKAVKTYADGIIAAADAMVYKGAVDCSGNPNYPAADCGHAYKVSGAGKIGGAGGLAVEVGDLLLCIHDATASGDQATVGAYWDIVQVNLDGAVIGPASAADGNFASYSGTSGKLVADSGSKAADFAVAAKGVTNGDSHDHDGGDGAQIDHTKLSNLPITSSGHTMATGKVLGRATASTGAIEELDVTGTGSVVKATSPTLEKPNIGAATGTSLRLTTLGDAPAANQIAARAYNAYAEGSQAGHVWKTYSSSGSAYGNMIQAWRMRGTFDTPVVCNSGDYVLLIRGWSYDTSGNRQLGASYNIVTDGAPASNRVQMYHVWWTQDSSATLAERMRLHSAGTLSIGTTTDGLTAGGSLNVAQDIKAGVKFGLGLTPIARRPHVADPSGGATTDAEARTAINAILETLEAFGFHATK